jgi:excisionase family DNA binding protein
VKAESQAQAMEPLMTVAEVAGVLRYGEQTVWRMVRHKEIAHVRMGKDIRFRPEDVRAFVAGLLVNAREEGGAD